MAGAVVTHAAALAISEVSQRTLHLIGDIHARSAGQASGRMDTVLADMANCPIPLYHVQVGDLIEDGSANTAAQEAIAFAFLDALPSSWELCFGNHDWSGQANGVGARTTAAIESAYGRSRNRTVDLGDKTLIIVSPDGFDTVLDTTALNYLDNALAAATKDCFILCHCPLENTVAPTTNGGTEFSSNEAFFSLDPNSSVRTILNNRSRAKVVISGHTHSPLSATDFIKLENVGSRNVLCVNASAVYYVGRTVETSDPVVTLFMDWDDDSVTLRYRDHVAGAWTQRPGVTAPEEWALPA